MPKSAYDMGRFGTRTEIVRISALRAEKPVRRITLPQVPDTGCRNRSTSNAL